MSYKVFAQGVGPLLNSYTLNPENTSCVVTFLSSRSQFMSKIRMQNQRAKPKSKIGLLGLLAKWDLLRSAELTTSAPYPPGVCARRSRCP